MDSKNKNRSNKKFFLTKEGLSYSDYFSDQVPAEVKPVYSLTPMEEDGGESKIKNGQSPTEIKTSDYGGWMDKDGDYYRVDEECHSDWAYHYLNSIGYNVNYTDCYVSLFNLGFIRIIVYNRTKTLFFQTSNQSSSHPIKNIQLRNLKNFCIENQFSLRDSSDKEIELNEQEDNFIGMDDIPLQSKSLFKGLWEKDKNSIKLKSLIKNKKLFIKENIMKEDKMEEFKSNLVDLFNYLKKEFKLKNNPKVKLVSDQKNADKMLGKTAYYNPEEKTISLFVVDRHPKDILRSFSHEVVHFFQHEKNMFNINSQHNTELGYAQSNKSLRQAEKHAYLLGSICFRDWEDKKKVENRKDGKKMAEIGKNGQPMTQLIKNTYKSSHPYVKYNTNSVPRPENVEEDV